MKYLVLSPLILAALLTFSALPLLHAEDLLPATGSITGRIVDPTGNPIPDANVKAILHLDPKDPPKKGTKTATTTPSTSPAPSLATTSDAQGNFIIPSVAPAKYDVLATSSDKKLIGETTTPVIVKPGSAADTGPLTLKPR